MLVAISIGYTGHMFTAVTRFCKAFALYGYILTLCFFHWSGLFINTSRVAYFAGLQSHLYGFLYCYSFGYILYHPAGG